MPGTHKYCESRGSGLGEVSKAQVKMESGHFHVSSLLMPGPAEPNFCRSGMSLPTETAVSRRLRKTCMPLIPQVLDVLCLFDWAAFCWSYQLVVLGFGAALAAEALSQCTTNSWFFSIGAKLVMMGTCTSQASV